MRTPFHKLVILGLIGLLARGAWSDTLFTVDGQTLIGSLTSVDTSGNVVWKSVDGKIVTRPAYYVDRIKLAATPAPVDASSGWLVSAGRMRFPGRPGTSTDSKLVWEHASLGKFSFAFENVRVYLPPALPKKQRTGPQMLEALKRFIDSVRDTDVVYLANGDEIAGVVESFGAASVGFNCKVGKIDVQASSLLGVTFSGTLKKYVAPAGTHARLELTDGSIIIGTVKSAGDKLRVTTSLGPKLDVPKRTVVRIRFLNTKLVNLADLEPVLVRETPYFDRVWPWQRNRSVWGRPMTIAKWKYEGGIGMHARCQLDYAIDGKYRIFLTDVGIDEEVGDAGSCVVAVYGDGKVLMAPVQITGKMGPKKLRIDVSKVKRLTLLADFGSGNDAGDHVNWGNARLVRK